MKHHSRHIPLICTVVLGLSLCFVQALPVDAEPAPDPYADAVDDTITGMIILPNAAIGTPDGGAATVGGMGEQHFVLDMGVNEEGTGDLARALPGHHVGCGAHHRIPRCQPSSASHACTPSAEHNRRAASTHRAVCLDAVAVPLRPLLDHHGYVRP